MSRAAVMVGDCLQSANLVVVGSGAGVVLWVSADVWLCELLMYLVDMSFVIYVWMAVVDVSRAPCCELSWVVDVHGVVADVDLVDTPLAHAALLRCIAVLVWPPRSSVRCRHGVAQPWIHHRRHGRRQWPSPLA